MRPEGPGDTKKIQAALADTGKTFTRIAEETGVSLQSVSAYARGLRKPAAGNLSRLAKSLGIHPLKLMKDDYLAA